MFNTNETLPIQVLDLSFSRSKAQRSKVTERIIGELEKKVLDRKLDQMVEIRIKQKLGLS